ncbi:MAG: hypothetical protein A2790_19860 [Phenylobacterium sp. RIFCSPHIGHO2_01_FULL_69_31]|uniref:alanyl-tRNA editing protein n=1 Tax=Phenylobacterium sp. RIFCSPHIGHO2_01_FULL_69_31 TaxID=1801944 RepID=UPI0008CC46A1|nr:alanyl-tRNA editing protein [Phenylobacterium sp. RIFCSPHIGHO2_01_FULL_69_31]OHB26227.1 MAG: hypothetical protein A2790_19860 [Phenylobacterium sp. RIFCSPHIGHO2_01_FULL_69_31]
MDAFDELSCPALPATKRLFHDDPYLRVAEAEVLWAHGPFVVLDQTLFYAESGGQEPDHGFINGLAVEDAQYRGGRLLEKPPISVGAFIVHRLAAPTPFRAGETVSMQIDWARRYANMRNHTACHFMYAGLQTLWGGEVGELPSRGCHIHPEGSRMDFGADLTPEAVEAAEGWANAKIREGGSIEMRRNGVHAEIFEWIYPDMAPIECGGTHCRNAGELGTMTLKRKRKGIGITRVTATLM